MKLIILNRGSRAARCLDIASGHAWIAGLAVAAVVAVAATGGYALGGAGAANPQLSELQTLRAELAAQREELQALGTSADEHIDALALRAGELNAHVIRLNALGSRLTGMADLEDGEFDFANAPAMGGPADDDGNIDDSGQLPNLLADLESLESTLDNQLQQLTALEGLMLDSKLSNRARPSGRPVRKGWQSSYFGKRSDPLTGKSSWHKGVDFAGKRGDDIIAVSDGVVTFSGDRYGYGNLVEVRHGNGYVTRYAHNQQNLVAVGDVVTQGQTIALIGSTGRSTGPHVHFEVHRNGQAVDPAKYIRNR
ncbi:MAG: peptidoglycan DD-metalloendopeptidase family protein [Gammaproteobacteria bacterium]|nr:M23 family metallopeptidase [Gammaproteobacteria bacterium]NND54889.1 peptidoglycan DD-metalloendopeptidase family protein [Gammaproteobacteria bacterium]